MNHNCLKLMLETYLYHTIQIFALIVVLKVCRLIAVKKQIRNKIKLKKNENRKK